ncbi:DUF4350 domain-containing protein [Streptomyces sp. DSM 44917]|uniref:DUF4350 domain-containing protein n=1 Tax=Streptomyces boetiae TaxID=3075541 RepID=A0ABU2LEI9_9ACTN|nr:DUF4350 domain-containing protein [Streptomyces sp. DSM 44917]MDT0309981.1 DUF4350 domain-containing protein [Streptomyces sp. DSM 44917]
MTAPAPAGPEPAATTGVAPDVPADASPPPDAPAGTAVSPTARQLWRRGRGLLIALALLVVTGLLIALLTSGESAALHPRSAAQNGSRAVAELLAGHGVRTTLATTADEAARAAGPGTTLLIARPDALTDRARDTLARAAGAEGARTVLIAPAQDALDAFAPGVLAAAPAPAQEREPRCAEDAPRRAGSARLGGYRYAVPPGQDTNAGCYPADGLPTLVTLPREGGGAVVLMGTPEPLYNEHLDEDGNASLALQLLGAHAELVWYLPSGQDAPEGGDGLLSLVDPGWRWATLQLAIAAALAALWRGRRLGPVVPEALPVVVPAAETTEGHARLYHRAGARDRAAAALRAAARARLAPLVGLPPAAAHAPETLPGAVAAHTGDAPPELTALLFGPPPRDDQALIRLADALDALERRVAATGTPDPDATR